MGRAGLAFALGILGFHLLPDPPSDWPGALPCLLALAICAWILPRLRGLLLLALGIAWAQLHATVLLHDPFPDALARVPLTVEGRIASIPAQSAHRVRFLFEIERARSGTTEVPATGLVRLSCYQDCPRLLAGEHWRFAVRLKPRHGYLNPGGFDYERWLFERGIKATGHVLASVAAERLHPDPGPYWLTRWRQSLADHLARTLGDAETLGLVQALAIGETSGFAREDWEILALTGTSHLVAISGLNVGLIAGFFLVLTRWLWSRSVRLTLALAAPRAGVLAGSLAALAYSALAGFSVSTQRALIMLAVVFAALYWRRTLRPYHALLVALVGVLVVDPQAVLSYGFWLSFGGVAILLLNLGQRLPSRDPWTRWGRAQWAVTIGLLPMLLFLFGRISLVAPVVNLVAVPLFSLILLPLVLSSTLLSLIPGLDWPLSMTADLLAWCMDALAWIARSPWVATGLAHHPTWVWAVAMLGAVLLLAPRGLPGRWLGLVLLLPLLVLRPPVPSGGEVWLTLLDVGQGVAAVVETQAGILVYDTGPGYPSGFETGSLVLAPFLQSRGIKRVDRLVISHADKDHVGGMPGLLARIPAARILSGEPRRLDIETAESCRAGEGWEWSGVSFRFLHPAGAGEEGNNASCVLKITAGGRSILLTGDVETGVERDLVKHLGSVLRADILIAGHHGSATSTSAVFLDAVRPDWVFFSAGYANQFGFPAVSVRERVAERGIRSLNTAFAGAIQVRLGADGRIGDPLSWRHQSARLWTHRPSPPP